MIDEGAFVGSDGKINHAHVGAVLNGGRSGETGDHAVSITVDVGTSASTYWFGGMTFDAGVFRVDDLDQYELTADILAQEGGEFQVRLESGLNNAIGFNSTGTGQWQSIGGLLSTGIEFGNFAHAGGEYRLVVSFFNEQDTWGRSGGTLTLDNLEFTRLIHNPEPGTLVTVMALGMAGLCVRRRPWPHEQVGHDSSRWWRNH